MRRRPAWLGLLSLIFVGIAFSLPVQIMIIYGHGFDEISATLDKLTALNWLVIGFAFLCAFLVSRGSPYVRVAVPTMIGVVGINNFFVGYYETDFSMLTASLSTLALFVVNLPLLSPQVQTVLFNPEKRWWLRPDRRRMNVPVIIEGTRLRSTKAETFDISLTGAFVPAAGDVCVGDWITLRMKFGTFNHFRCQALVVRRSEPAGSYPSGVGVQFMNMSWRERKELRRCLEKSV